jgi:Mg/Co/Ni transporter MgtE
MQSAARRLPRPELEAHVFEELADDQQLEFVEERTDTDIAELIACMETDDAYDLTVVPVLDDEERPIGVVTVDDILELLLQPRGGRFGIFGGS